MKNTVITLPSGSKLDFLRPSEDSFDIVDIAIGTAKECRFSGLCEGWLSVAEHQISVAKELKALGYSRTAQLAGLIHDASEAYLRDICTPFKRLLNDYLEYN